MRDREPATQRAVWVVPHRQLGPSQCGCFFVDQERVLVGIDDGFVGGDGLKTPSRGTAQIAGVHHRCLVDQRGLDHPPFIPSDMPWEFGAASAITPACAVDNSPWPSAVAVTSRPSSNAAANRTCPAASRRPALRGPRQPRIRARHPGCLRHLSRLGMRQHPKLQRLNPANRPLPASHLDRQLARSETIQIKVDAVKKLMQRSTTTRPVGRPDRDGSSTAVITTTQHRTTDTPRPQTGVIPRAQITNR